VKFLKKLCQFLKNVDIKSRRACRVLALCPVLYSWVWRVVCCCWGDPRTASA